MPVMGVSGFTTNRPIGKLIDYRDRRYKTPWQQEAERRRKAESKQ